MMSDLAWCKNCKHLKGRVCYCPCFSLVGSDSGLGSNNLGRCNCSTCMAVEDNNPDAGFTLDVDKVLLNLAKEG